MIRDARFALAGLINVGSPVAAQINHVALVRAQTSGSVLGTRTPADCGRNNR